MFVACVYIAYILYIITKFPAISIILLYLFIFVYFTRTCKRFQTIFSESSDRVFRPGPHPKAVRRRRSNSIFAHAVQTVRCHHQSEHGVHRGRHVPIGSFRSVVSARRQNRTKNFTVDFVRSPHYVSRTLDRLLQLIGKRYTIIYIYIACKFL